MTFIELAARRHSVRKYASTPVEDEKLAEILEAARLAPTAANLQPCRIIAVTGKDARKKLSLAAETYGAPAALIVCADKSRAWTRPFDGKNTSDIDAAIVTCHAMLCAVDLGLGSVWICYFKPDVLKKEFALGKDIEPVNILALGYADESGAPAEKSRIPIEELVRFE